jgi:hypothetical protein
MSTITNLSNKHVGYIKAECSDRNLWIYGYDLSVEEEGPAVARLKKIIRGLRNLTMVDEETLRAHEHPVATVRQLEEVKGKIMFMLNHPASKALALKVEEAVLAVGDGRRETLMCKWHGRGTALTNDGRLAAAGQPVRYGGGLIATSRPQWVNRNRSPAVGQTGEAPCTLKSCQKTHGVASTTRLRGGGPNAAPEDSAGDRWRAASRAEKRQWVEEDGTEGRPGEREQQGEAPLSGWGRQRKWREEDSAASATLPTSNPTAAGWAHRSLTHERYAEMVASDEVPSVRHAVMRAPGRAPSPDDTVTGRTPGPPLVVTASPCYSAMDIPQSPQGPPSLRRMLTTTNDLLHHVREWVDQATWGVQENSWRAGLLDDKGKIRYGWGNVAKTFGEDPRWTDYITEVRCGDNPNLTWEQYVDALITRDGQAIYPNGHEGRQWQRGKRSQEPQSQTPRPQAKAIASSKLPYGQTSKKAFKSQEHKRAMALSLEKQSTIASMARYEEELQKQKVEEDNRRAMAKRWTDNRGEKVASTPHLPPDMWARILQEGPDERAQLAAWVAWANSTLLQLVVVWFRTGGQRDSRWLGRLINEKGNITMRDTDNIAKRLAPWCKAILQPGSQNEPLNYETGAAPAVFVSVHQHMLSMMTYLGFDDVIERLQRILRMLAQCVRPGSGLPKYIPGPPDSDDEEDDWEDDVPEPGPQPPLPQKTFVARTARTAPQ